MAKRISEQPKEPTKLIVPKELAELRLAEQITKGKALLATQVSTSDQYDKLDQDHTKWNKYNSTLLTTLFSGREIVDEYEFFHGGSFSMAPSLQQQTGYIKDDVNTELTRLESFKERLDLYAPFSMPIVDGSPSPTASTRDVFIVHGHNEGVRDSVARFISKLDLNPIILGEQASEGKTVIEKFEKHSNVSFAVVLMTADEFASTYREPDKKENRARPNVVLELGYFIARLGRNKVAALKEKGVSVPSDFHGVVYIDFDTAGAWQITLAKEMRSAGIPIDMNKAV